VAAFVLSSLVVSLVLYDKVRLMLPITGGTPAFSVSNNDTRLPSTSLSTGDLELGRAAGTARAKAHARGEPVLGDTFNAAASAASAAPAAAPPGISALSNEDLLADLDRQKRKAGIRGYAAKPPPEIEAYLKLRAGLDAQLLKASPLPATVGGQAPALLSADQGVAAAKALPVEKGRPLAETSPSAASSAEASAPAEAEGLLLKSAQEREKAWTDHGMHAAAPTVNYDVNMVALVVAPDLTSAVEVMGVETRAGKVIVKYRLFARMEDVASAARKNAGPVRSYQFRVIPRTDKPVVFSRVE
jgi:hypothetical protein